jgi:hypothetical protein
MKIFHFRFLSWLGTAGLTVVFSSVQDGSEGRKQLNFMSSGEEMQLGLSTKINRKRPSTDLPLTRRSGVGKRIAAVAGCGGSLCGFDSRS